MTSEAAMRRADRNHRHVLLRRDAAGIDAGRRPFAGDAADILGSAELIEIEAAVEVIVALHLGAFARDRADGAAETGGHIGAGKP